jgi:hypothetical protein
MRSIGATAAPPASPVRSLMCCNRESDTAHRQKRPPRSRAAARDSFSALSRVAAAPSSCTFERERQSRSASCVLASRSLMGPDADQVWNGSASGIQCRICFDDCKPSDVISPRPASSSMCGPASAVAPLRVSAAPLTDWLTRLCLTNATPSTSRRPCCTVRNVDASAKYAGTSSSQGAGVWSGADDIDPQFELPSPLEAPPRRASSGAR